MMAVRNNNRRSMASVRSKDPRDRNKKSTSFYVPLWMLAKLEEIADEKGFKSRNDYVIELCRSAIEQHEAERSAKK